LDSLENGFKHSLGVIYSVTLRMLFWCIAVISHRRNVSHEYHISVVKYS